MAGRHPLIDGGQIEHACGEVRLREATGQQRGQFGVKFRCRKVQTPRSFLQIIASTLGFTWQIFRPAVENDYDEIFARPATEHFDAVNVIGFPFNNQNAARICQLALRHRIPAVSETATWAKCGLLLTYGQDVSWTAARGSAAHWKRAISKEFKRTQLPSIEYRWSTNT